MPASWARLPQTHLQLDVQWERPCQSRGGLAPLASPRPRAACLMGKQVAGQGWDRTRGLSPGLTGCSSPGSQHTSPGLARGDACEGEWSRRGPKATVCCVRSACASRRVL